MAAALIYPTLFALLVGCSPADDSGQQSPPGETEDALGHVHGLGVNPADGALYAASHYGVLRVAENGDDVVRVADRWQDTMAFTVVGPDHFLASGHPDLREGLPPHLGLIESTDAAESWRALSLQGEADFHALEVTADRVYGYDATSGRLMHTEDRRTWRTLAEADLIDIAVNPSDEQEILATTPDGRVVSYRDTGEVQEFSEGPALLWIDWSSEDLLVGVGADGRVYRWADARWSPLGQLPGDPQAIEVGASGWFAASSTGIYRSTDDGRTWATLVPAP